MVPSACLPALLGTAGTGWLTEAFAPSFMQRALVAGLVASVAAAVVGTWIVLRGLTFLGDALAHGVIPGLALAVLWGFSPILGALLSALVMSGAVTLVGRRARVREDVGIGLLFVGMLALGVVIISRSQSFSTDVTALLFGDILGVTAADIRGQVVAAVLVVGASLVLHRPFLALAFNQDKARTLGMRPALAHTALLVLVAVAIVASFDAIGTLLVFGLLIGPPATATLLVRRVPLVMTVAVALGASAVVVGLLISYHQGTAGGATIAGVAVLEFLVVLAAQETRRAVREARTRRGNPSGGPNRPHPGAEPAPERPVTPIDP
ncbi:zinc ABC transporter permease AztB [Iamia majanohamensis]|uniref:Zinc ABC transporter permease AztB n=1 Tax=Iamia majanohamensis TaxID=467976 RepID=A0AAE9YHX6_9ACTN|nr:zinc ABC transporter permease AztB [Iamia majanohamensis]WCO68822.1 zinc ABC transporter permease AztB [Iamia majanohamensis]